MAIHRGPGHKAEPELCNNRRVSWCPMQRVGVDELGSRRASRVDAYRAPPDPPVSLAASGREFGSEGQHESSGEAVGTIEALLSLDTRRATGPDRRHCGATTAVGLPPASSPRGVLDGLRDGPTAPPRPERQ